MQRIALHTSSTVALLVVGMLAAAPALADKPQVVVLNKTDATASDDVDVHRSAFLARGVELLTMSAVTGAGVDAVLERLWSWSRKGRVR